MKDDYFEKLLEEHRDHSAYIFEKFALGLTEDICRILTEQGHYNNPDPAHKEYLTFLEMSEDALAGDKLGWTESKFKRFLSNVPKNIKVAEVIDIFLKLGYIPEIRIELKAKMPEADK